MSTKKKNKKNKKKTMNDFKITDIQDPNERFMATSYAFFRIEEVQGRAIKKYNLIISRKEGNWFTSSNSRLDPEIVRRIQKVEGPNMWSLGWMMKSKMHEENHGSTEKLNFFCLLNLDDVECEQFGKIEAGQFCYYGQDWEPYTAII
jgi:hypothetical protein